jgi:ADP-heptose:LPS heptosyltransferase
LEHLERVLLVRPDKIGDLVLSLPAAAVLKERFPGVRIDVLASSYNARLLPYTRHVDQARLFTDARGEPRPVTDVARELAAERYDAAVFLKPDWGSAAAAFRARIPRRVGTWRRACSILFNQHVNNRRKHAGLHEIDLNLMLLRPFGVDAVRDGRVPVLETDASVGRQTRAALGVPREYVVVHAGSGGSVPNWPRDSYSALVNRLGATRAVVLTAALPLPATAGAITDCSGNTTFDDLVHLLAGASAVVAGSTGPLHVAAALGTPVVGLLPNHRYLGPQRWGPRGPRVSVLTPASGEGHRCLLRPDGSCACMESISVAEVADALHRIEMPFRQGTVRSTGVAAE